MTDKQDILSRLDIPSICRELIPSLKPSGGNGFIGLCPSHDDHNESLSISHSGAFKCFACNVKGGFVDLYMLVNGLTFKEAMAELSAKAGIVNEKMKQKVTGSYDYHDADGNRLYWKERVEPGRNKAKDFYHYHGNREKGRGCDPVLYHLPDVMKAKSIIVVEGEKHADLLKSWGLTGTTLDSGAQSKPTPVMIDLLSGKRIAILRDNDKAGLDYALTLSNALYGKCESLKVVLLPGLPEKGDICDWVKEPGNDKARLLEIIMAADKWEPEEPATEENESPVFDLSRLTLGSNIVTGDYEVTFVVEKLIPENAVVLFYAKGGSGKSTLATQIGGAVVASMPFMGLNTSKRPVVIIDYENPLAVLSKRVKVVQGAETVLFWTGKDEPPQLNKASWKELRHLVATLQNPLLIIDTLSSSCSGLDILSNGDFSPVMQHIVELRNQGATIVLLHHTPKQDETKYIGASCIYNQCDHILAMYPVKTAGVEKEVIDEDEAKVYRLGTRDKTRFEHFTMYVEFDEDRGVFVPAADPDKDLLDRLQKIIFEMEPVNQTTIINQIGAAVSKGKLIRLLKHNDGSLWNVERGENNAKLYRAIRLSGFPSLYRRETEKPESGFSIPPEKPNTADTLQLPLNSGFAGFPEGIGEPENVPVFDESDFADLGAI